MIEIKHLDKVYGNGPKAVKALNGIDLHIQAGMFGLLGPNGAGKTPLMRILAGIVAPSQGNVQVDGHDLSTEKGKEAVKALLGYLPQESGLYPDLNARQFVDYMAILKGMNDPVLRRKQVERVLEMVGLQADAGRKLKTYSGGMKRRVGIAQALVNDPRLLIVDEPTSGLDGGTVDLMNPQAVRKFIEVYYEEFHRRYGEYFGNGMPATFADHEGT